MNDNIKDKKCQKGERRQKLHQKLVSGPVWRNVAHVRSRWLQRRDVPNVYPAEPEDGLRPKQILNDHKRCGHAPLSRHWKRDGPRARVWILLKRIQPDQRGRGPGGV